MAFKVEFSRRWSLVCQNAYILGNQLFKWKDGYLHYGQSILQVKEVCLSKDYRKIQGIIN